MKKLIVTAVSAAISLTTVCAAVYQDGAPREGVAFPGITIEIREEIGADGLAVLRVSQKASLFSSRFADVYYSPDLLNRAESKDLAKAVAVTVAKQLGSTNSVCVVHREIPAPEGTNVVDRINAWLRGRDVIDEVVPLDD